MINFLQEQNEKFWNALEKELGIFSNQKAQRLLNNERDTANLYALSTIGRIASDLAEFYEKAYRKSFEKENQTKLMLVISQKLDNFQNHIAKNLKEDIKKERNYFEIKLISHGYRGDTYATASDGLFNAVKNQSSEMGEALNITIYNFTKINERKNVENNPIKYQEMSK